MRYKYAIVPLLLSLMSLALSYVCTWQHEAFPAIIAFVMSAIFAAQGKQFASSAGASNET